MFFYISLTFLNIALPFKMKLKRCSLGMYYVDLEFNKLDY